MEAAIVILLLIIGAFFGAMLGYIWGSDKGTVRDQFDALPEHPEHIARKAQA